jgi:SNF2 family DNA or RNA helicase
MATTTTVKLTPTVWQIEDLEHLVKQDASANWSQMGCYKTSTALWLTEAKTEEVENPSVLIVTTRSGKGAYFRDIPRCLSGRKWQIFNVKADGVYIVIDDSEIKIAKYLPDVITFPHIVVTHYNTFSKSHLGKKEWCSVCNGRGKLPPDYLEKCIACDGKRRVDKELRICDYLMRREWDVLICDEAHRMKNGDTKWTVSLKKIKAKTKHIMTGSGFVNRPDEIWSLLNFLDKTQYRGYWAFRDEYCMIDDYSGYSTVVGLNPYKVNKFRRIRQGFGPRRTKPECFPNLTEPIFEDIEIELNAIQRAMYNQIMTELRFLDQKGEPIHSPNVLSQLQRMRQIAVATPDIISDEYDDKQNRRVVKIRLIEPSSKIDALMEVIEGLEWDDEDRQQIVVFSNFNDPLELLQTRLNKVGVKWIRLLQADSDQERYRKWSTFPEKKAQVFLSTIKLGGESIDLTSAQYVAFLDMDWAPANNDQAIARVWRPGYSMDNGAPIVIRFFAKDTVDKYILDMNEMKAKWFKTIFHDDDTNTGELPDGIF